jgi:DNA polymerase (family X)
VKPGNTEVASALSEIADLLELRGEGRFRVNAYRRAADAISAASRPVAGLTTTELTSLKDVGKSVATKVEELCTSGKIASLEELRAEIPEGVREMTDLPGLGPKRAMLVFTELGVKSLEELREAATGGRLSTIKGLGEKVQEQVLRAIERGERGKKRVLLGQALPLAERMLEELRGKVELSEATYAGSLRRMKESIGDLDLLVASSDPEAVMAAFRLLESVEASRAEGGTKSTVVTAEGLSVDLRVVEPEAFGSALQYFTGSQAHNVKVREHAVRKGLKLSEYGLFDAKTGKLLASRTEEEVYERLGMQWVPPTMREDHGEVEMSLDGDMPKLVELEDIRGDLQSHSTYSDGRAALRDMVAGAVMKGYDYYAITDHSRLAGRDLSVDDRMSHQREEIESLREEVDGRIDLLWGVEVNILPDGSLDLDDEVLSGFDVVVASVHSAFTRPQDEQTARLVRACGHPLVNVIGHPTGRRIGRRDPIEVDIVEVARAAAEGGVAMEINAHPHRLDLRDDHVRWVGETGCRFVISTDAHSVAELDNMRYGVATAQRGWTEPDRVINTWTRKEIRSFLAKESV